MSGLWLAGILAPAERFLTDKRYQLRHSWGQTPALSPDLAVVWIDDASYQAIDKHWVFWLELYAEVMTAALQSGATVVGLDVIPSYYEASQLPAFKPLIPFRGRVVMGAFLNRTAGLKTPPEAVVALLGADNLALLNLTRDEDGIFRVQHLTPVRHEELGLDAFPFLAAKMAQIHTDGKVSLPRSLPVNFTVEEFPSLSFHQVLKLHREGRQAELEKFFRGKAVLIASSSLQDQDLVETPIHRKDAGARVRSTFGGEAHLQVLNTLLTGQFLTRPASAFQAALWFVLCALLSVAFFRIPWWAGGLLMVLAELGIWGAGLWVFVSWSSLWSLTPPLLAVPLLAGSVYAYRQRTDEQARRRLNQAFGRYVSKDVMEEMLRFPEDYDPSLAQEREVTVFFSDINGFSTVCEGKSASQVTAMLNEHFVEMTNIIFRNGGTLIRFNGDEFMVLFGAPKQHPTPEAAAVTTALEMVARLKEMESRDPTGKNGFYNVKIGIHTGKMILTSIGTAQRSDYNAIGDSANLASRVMSLAKQENQAVLMSEAVWSKARASDRLEAELQGEYEVKGREGKVRVFRPFFK